MKSSDSSEAKRRSTRPQLAAILRKHADVFSVADAAAVLNEPRSAAARQLARWAEQGRLRRVRQGLYMPVPLEAASSDQVTEDPWVLAAQLFTPGFIAGWSAAEHWGLTEQVFPTVAIVTSRTVRDREPTIGRTKFHIRTLKPELIFGTRTEWRGRTKIAVADPSRTVVDMLDDPRFGGGIRFVADVVREYLRSDKKDLNLLLEHAERLKRGAVFKRLGYLLEQSGEDEASIRCRQHMKQGLTQLDPSRPGKRLVTRWRLWVPEGFNIRESS